MNLVNSTHYGYKFLSVIGEGAQSTVYKAQNIQQQQLYAIKVIKQYQENQENIEIRENSENRENAENRILRKNLEDITPENTYIGIFDHQNVITYYGEFNIRNCKCFIIDHCQGSLHDYFQQNNYRLDDDQIKQIILQIINGLIYLHQKNIIHRDLNINNILLKDGVWKIADFGFSIQSDKPQNLILGTSGYMAPEMFDPKGYDNKVDIFSLGCIFYQLYHGRLPFPNDTLENYKRSILSAQEPQYDDNIEFQLFDLIYQMLRFDPYERINLTEIQMDIFENLQNYYFDFRKNINYEEFEREAIPEEQYSNIIQKQYLKQRTTNLQIKKQIQEIQFIINLIKSKQKYQFLRELCYLNIQIINDVLFKVRKSKIYYPLVIELQLEQNLIFLQSNPNANICISSLLVELEQNNFGFNGQLNQAKIGKTLHQYQFDEFLSSGSFGAVFKGRDLSNGKIVAIKLVAVESFDNSQGIVGELLLNEINIMKEIENDNVVRFLDYFQSKSFAYIIMEYCDGGNLHDYWIKNKQKVPPFEALKIMKQILNGMRGLHEKFVMHRDLKLVNILIHEDVIKIADLGFSCRLQDENDLQTLSLGTQGLMAPEVAASQLYGLEADVFSVGAIFYQLLYGRLPFDDASLDAFLYDVRNNKPKYSKIDPSYDDLLQDILSKMLEFERFKRISFADIYDHKIMKLQAPRGSLIDKGQVKLNSVDFNKSIEFYKQSNKDQQKFEVLKSDGKLPVFNLNPIIEILNDLEPNTNSIILDKPNQQQNDNNFFKRNPQKLDSGVDFSRNYIPTPQENSLGEKTRAIEEGCKKYLDFYNYIQILIQLSEDLQLVQYKNVYPIMYPRLQLQKFIYFKQYDLLDDIRKKKNMFNLEYIDNILETQEMKYIFERIYKEVVDSKDVYCQNQYEDLKTNLQKCQEYMKEQFMTSAKISHDSDFNKNFKTSMKQLRDYLYNQEINQVKQYDEMLRIILNITNLLNLSDREFKQLYGRVKTMDINSLSKEVTNAIQREQQ